MTGATHPPLLLAADAGEIAREFGPHALFILGVVFITAWLVIRIRKRGARNATQPTAREQMERYKTRDAVRGDLEGLMVDIEQLARRLGAQLDAKSQQLETLLAEADRRIAALGGEAPPTPPPVDRYEPSAGPAGEDRAVEAPPPQADTEPPSIPTPTPAPAPALAPAPAPADSPHADPHADPPPDPLVAQVYALADENSSAPDIARDLGEPIGKVELILALRKS